MKIYKILCRNVNARRSYLQFCRFAGTRCIEISFIFRCLISFLNEITLSLDLNYSFNCVFYLQFQY